MRVSLEAQVSAALASRAPESSVLDYKAALYEKTESGRKEFAKDLAGFANRAGGTIIIGVREENGLPSEIVGIPPEDLDAAVLWLESVARSGLNPHHSSISIRSIDRDGENLIAVEVPKGLEQPYEVPSAGARFFVRDERSVRAMSREELKFAIRREADIAERIDAFCGSCWRDLLGADVSPSNRLIANQGGCQLIAFPLFEQSFEFRFDLPTVARDLPLLDTFNERNVGSARATISGLEYRQSQRSDGKFPGFVRIYRHGAVQMCDGYVMDFRERDNGQGPMPLPHPGGYLMDSLLGSIERAIETSQKTAGAQTFWIDFRILTKEGHTISFFSDIFGHGAGKADHDELVFDHVILNTEDGWKGRVPNLCRPLLDQIWQAFGFERCKYFDENGIYKKPS